MTHLIDIEDQRRQNLRALIRAFGCSASKFTEKLTKVDPSYLSQINTRKRPFTEKTARQIEQDLNLPESFLDDDGLSPRLIQLAVTDTDQLKEEYSQGKEYTGMSIVQDSEHVIYRIDPKILKRAIEKLDEELSGWGELTAHRRSRLIMTFYDDEEINEESEESDNGAREGESEK